jgi:hypothetical protein
MGRHDELIAINGFYANLVHEQLCTDEKDNASSFREIKRISSYDCEQSEQTLSRVLSLESNDRFMNESQGSSIDRLKSFCSYDSESTEDFPVNSDIDVYSRMSHMIVVCPQFIIAAFIGSAMFGAVFPCE